MPQDTQTPIKVPDSYIKNIALEIHSSYHLSNSPYAISSNVEEWRRNRKRFIGREEQIKKFGEFLRNPQKRGVFLVTGYRGMGKSSFVNYVLDRYKWTSGKGRDRSETDAKAIITVHLTLAQNKPREIDILRLITSSVYDKYLLFLRSYQDEKRSGTGKMTGKKTEGKFPLDKEQRARIRQSSLYISQTAGRRKRLALMVAAIFSLAFGLVSLLAAGGFADLNDRFPLIGSLVAACGVLAGLIFYFIFTATQHKAAYMQDGYARIRQLYERAFSQVGEQETSKTDINIQGIQVPMADRERSKSRQYPLSGVKELEYELMQFLHLVRQEVEFIFVFDELDKVEAVVSNTFMYAEMETFEKHKNEHSSHLDARERKQAVLNVISGLKNFFTAAEARFIFIAGHEMFDASLADIADRQASISSIFTYTFNIESFFKEKKLTSTALVNVSLSYAVEEFIKRVLFSPGEIGRRSLFDVARSQYQRENHARAISHEASAKIYFTLQNFVTYLTYRSNGSPKKIIKGIHEFISVGNSVFDSPGTDDRYMVVSRKETSQSNKRDYAASTNRDYLLQSKYLYFDYYNQYRIGLINYLYRPFLIQNGRNFKLQSDSIVLSTPYLFDHLLKFHPFAFSLSNLELIPEVLSTSKTVSLKEHILGIIDYLGANHLRETEIGLFDYKFYSKIQNEISYLSKLFDDEAAAFNFTLDESYLVKVHINNKIKELRSIYSKFLSGSSDTSQQIFSIAHLNGTLGDLHFFDQEFDDAIVTYSDAIRPINHMNVATMNLRDFITLIRNKLKLGLCFEKISSYEEALAFYADACQDAKRFLLYRYSNAVNDHVVQNITAAETPPGSADPAKKVEPIYSSSALSDLLQIVLQAFIAKMIIQEKMGMEGVTTAKMQTTLGGFLNLARGLEGQHFMKANHLIVANAFLLTGKLFYFKNTAVADVTNVDVNMPSTDEQGKPIDDDFVLDAIRRLQGVFNARLPGKPVTVGGERRRPVLALYFYIAGLAETVKILPSMKNLLLDVCDSKGNVAHELLLRFTEFNRGEFEQLSGHHYKYIAGFLSNIGDCLLGMAPETAGCVFNKIGVGKIFNLSLLKNEMEGWPGFLELMSNESSPSPGGGLVEVVKSYYLSGQFYLRNGRSVSCSFQYRKILQLFRIVLESGDNTPVWGDKSADVKEGINNFISFLFKEITGPALEIISQNAGNTDNHMLSKARDVLSGAGPGRFISRFTADNISNHPETREVLLLHYYIQVKLGKPVELERIDHLISPAYSIATQFTRVLELDFYAKVIHANLVSGTKEYSVQNCVNYLFSMLSILRILDIYGKDYMISSSYYAYTHFRVAEFLQTPSVSAGILNSVRQHIGRLLGAGSYGSFDPVYHFQMAKRSYGESLQLHTGGTAYRKQMGGMIYLEDDFNDNAYHFGAAIDRYLMLNEVFSDRIKSCERQLAGNAREKFDRGRDLSVSGQSR